MMSSTGNGPSQECSVCQTQCSLPKKCILGDGYEGWMYICQSSCSHKWFTSICSIKKNVRRHKLLEALKEDHAFSRTIPNLKSSESSSEESRELDLQLSLGRHGECKTKDCCLLECSPPVTCGLLNSPDNLTTIILQCSGCSLKWHVCSVCKIFRRAHKNKALVISHMKEIHSLPPTGQKPEKDIELKIEPPCEKRLKLSDKIDGDANFASLTHLRKSDKFSPSSAEYFKDEHERKGSGKRRIATKAFGLEDTFDTNESDYHLLCAQHVAGLTKDQRVAFNKIIEITLARNKETNFDSRTPCTSSKDTRRVYLEGSKAICNVMPVPSVSARTSEGFAHISIDDLTNNILAHGWPLLQLRWNVKNDWKDDNGDFHSLLLQEIYEKIIKMGVDIPTDLRIHQMFIWSDGFQKNSHVQVKKTDLQLITCYFVPPDGVKDIRRYTQPVALGQKKSEHQNTLATIFDQVTTVEKIEMRYCGREKKMVPIIVVRIAIQNDHVERVNNTQTLQIGTFHHWWLVSCKFHPKVPSCADCFLRRLKTVVNHTDELNGHDDHSTCEECADWFTDLSNKVGWFEPEKQYPRKKCPDSPEAPEGRDVCSGNNPLLPPCILSFPFLILAFRFALHNALAQITDKRYMWNETKFRAYLRACCFNCSLISNMWHAVTRARMYEVGKHEILPPPLWHQFEQLNLQLSDFVDTPMHMLFLGIMKHMMGNIGRLFHLKKELFANFCGVIFKQLEACNKLSIEWCRGLAFSSNTSLGVAGWQAEQFVAFARLSLIYFGYLDDFKNELDHDGFIALKQMLVLWNLLLSSLFGDDKCDPTTVDHYAKLFLSASLKFGETTTALALTGTKSTAKKGKKNVECFFEGTSNYFSLLNLKELLRRFVHMRVLWEGEREKYIKYMKGVLYSMQDTETCLTNSLQKLLQKICLDYQMEDNMHYSPNNYVRTAPYKIYRGWDSFREEHWNSGKLLSGIIIKGDKSIYICIQENSEIRLVKAKFHYDYRKVRLNSHYFVLFFDNPETDYIRVKDREALKNMITDSTIIHPMVTHLNEYSKLNGHTVISKAWRVQVQGGDMIQNCIDDDTFSDLLQP